MANREGFPSQVKNPHLNERGDAEQMQNDKFVATVWKDGKPVSTFYVEKIDIVSVQYVLHD